MAPKNKKGQKVLLTDFLADTSTGRSWADEMDELPTAPAPRDPNEPPNSGLGGSHLSRGDGNRYGDRDHYRRGGDREGMDRPTRVEIPIPDKPPYNAFVGNLSWEVGNSELEEFFGASNIVSIRLITDGATGKPKGYGYIEFNEREALVAATDKSGRELGGRPVRVSVAEPPKEREDRTSGAWRREGPLPTLDDNRRTRHSSHQERSSYDDFDRGERMGFGSKFVPSADTATNFRRTQSGRGFSRAEGGFGMESEGADRGERMGFGSKFVASFDEPRRDRDPPLRGSNFVPSRVTPLGSDDGHSASGSVRKAAMMDRKSTDAEPTAADTVSNWRRAKPLAPSEQEASPAAPPTALPTRRKLELSARTVTSSDGASTPPTSVVNNKPSPFGAAKPIDTSEREKAVQDKLNREQADSLATNAKKPTASLDATPEVEAKGSPSVAPSVAPSAAPKAPKPNPFGAAKPVDTLQKELEVEQKLARDKALLEEKLKKEALETKAVPSIPTNQPVKESAAAPVNSATSSSANQPPHPPNARASQPWSRWTAQPPPVSKPISNGDAAPSTTTTTIATATTTTAAPAPPPAAKGATSPVSPSLSSFRKEGISFAALAKTAAANPTSTPASTAAPKASARDDKAMPPTHPRTILKRVEGLEIKHE